MQFLSLLTAEQLADSGLAVHNPLDNSLLTTVKSYSADDVGQMIKDADAAKQDWQTKTGKQRAQILRTWYELIIENQSILAEMMTHECGKPLAESMGEVMYGASFIEWFAEEGKRIYGDIIPSHVENKQIMVLKQPIGVTAAITPWNFPLAMITRKAAPALAAGCPMIVKPAESTPLTALAIENLAQRAGIPKAIFRVVPTTEPIAVGKEMCANPTVRKLSFTGSTQVGRVLMRQCADNIKKLSLELGGNAPFIVYESADIKAAVSGAIASKFRNAGQTCVCVNRFLVQESVHDEFVQELTRQVDGFVQGNGMDPDVNIGPLIDKQALNKVQNLVSEAVLEGAKIVNGGVANTEYSTVFQPTILTNVTNDMAVSKAEIFGPIATITKFDTEAESIAIANDTIYGLASYFYSNDLGQVWRVMEGLEYGMVGVNEGIISTEVAPFGGVKQSGLGREGSKYGIDEYVELKYCLMGGLTQR
jgi:succinate-semialdehyde dehydrogenase/glutarate-semialdehyde dehydrogenase